MLRFLILIIALWLRDFPVLRSNMVKNSGLQGQGNRDRPQAEVHQYPAH